MDDAIVDERLMKQVSALADQLAAKQCRVLSAFLHREIWRECRRMVKDENWSVELAVAYEVQRRLHITEQSPWDRV